MAINLAEIAKKKNVIGRLIATIKKYLAHTTSTKCISVLKYFAIPSIMGSVPHAIRFNIIAFIWIFIVKSIID